MALRLDDVETAGAIYQRLLPESDDPALRSRVLEGLGLVAFRSGEPQKAADLLEQAVAESGGGVAERPALASALARSLALTGRLNESIAVLEACTEHYEDDGVQYVRFAGLLGAALTDNGDFREAELVLARAIRRGRELRDPYTQARLHWSQARLRSERGQDGLAAESARQALAILQTTEDTYAVGQAHQALAHIYLNQGKNLEALELLREGEPLMADAATPVELAQYRIEQARACAGLGESEAAGALAMTVLGTLQDLHAVDCGRICLLLGDVYEQIGDPARTWEVLELAVETLTNQPPSRFLVTACRRLAEILRSQGETDEAFELMERAIAVQQHLNA